MYKMILKDGSEIPIHEGGSIYNIVTDVDSYAAIDELSDKLTNENLSDVKFTIDEAVTGVYTNMTTNNPKFLITETKNGIEVSFSLRERTPDELHYDELTQQILNTQMGVCEIYEMLS